MKKIVAPVDFSEVSVNAARYAAHMAAWLNQYLVLLHVSESALSYTEVSNVPMSDYNLFDDKEQALKKLAGDLDAELAGQASIGTASCAGSALYEILGYCRRVHPYAVVLGTHGASSLTRFLFGSTTLGVIRECNAPVIVVPNEYRFKVPRHIGLASDLQNVMNSIPAAAIKTIVNDFGSRFEILHVDKDDEEQEPVLVEETRQLGTLFAEQRFKIRMLKSVFTEETLLTYAAAKQLDLLIVVPKKHTWFDLLVKHQHTKHIALHATVPVMVVKHIHQG